jgi:hypothetical protein
MRGIGSDGTESLVHAQEGGAGQSATLADQECSHLPFRQPLSADPLGQRPDFLFVHSHPDLLPVIWLR